MFSDEDSYKDIKYILFRDAAYKRGDCLCAFSGDKNLDKQIDEKRRNGIQVCEFSLRIGVDKFEKVLMEIANYLIHLTT